MADYTFDLTDRNQTTSTEITGVATECEGAYSLCLPARWTLTLPLSGSYAVTGVRTMTSWLKVYRDSEIVFNGICRHGRRKGDRDKAKGTFTFLDPIVWWPWRRLRDSTGNFALPSFSDPITVGELLTQAITNSQTYENQGDAGMGLALDGDDTTTANIYSALGDFPLSIWEVATFLASSAMGEWYVEPLDGSSSQVYGRLHTYDRMGSNVSGTASFEYGTGAFNCQEAEHVEDATYFSNALWYFVNKEDDEHWAFNVQRDDPDLPDPPQTALAGDPVAEGDPRDGGIIQASRDAVGYWQDMRFWSDTEIEANDPERPLFRRMWQLEQSLRLKAKETLLLTPTPEGPLPWEDFFLGDIVAVAADGLGLDEEIEGEQRVYGFKVRPDDNGVERMGPVLTSMDGAEVLYS